MSFNDYYKNYVNWYYAIYSYSKIILIEGEKIKNGQVYNIYLEEDGLFSTSILKKCYRYHRELTDASTLREMIIDFYGSSNVLRFQQN